MVTTLKYVFYVQPPYSRDLFNCRYNSTCAISRLSIEIDAPETIVFGPARGGMHRLGSAAPQRRMASENNKKKKTRKEQWCCLLTTVAAHWPSVAAAAMRCDALNRRLPFYCVYSSAFGCLVVSRGGRKQLQLQINQTPHSWWCTVKLSERLHGVGASLSPACKKW